MIIMLYDKVVILYGQKNKNGDQRETYFYDSEAQRQPKTLKVVTSSDDRGLPTFKSFSPTL